MQGSSGRPRTVVDPTREKAARRIAVRHVGEDVEETAARAVPLAHGRKSIFFTQGRADTERVRQAFDLLGVPALVHHSSVSRELREEAEARFMGTEGPAALVSTSTLELGIDVGDLDVILHLDAPFTVSSFLQRMGRTGRRPGTYQHLEFFTSTDEALLQAVALVSLASRGFVEGLEPSRANTPVFLHQILAHVLERSGVGRKALWRALRGPTPFEDISPNAYDRIVGHLLGTGVLSESDGMLSLGEEGERAFGGRNFFDLYSVFETSPEVTVKTPEGRIVGTLETEFVWRMQGKELTFLLAGTRWRATEVDLDRALVVAVPVAGAQPPWWGVGGGILGREVAEEMRRVLLTDAAVPFADEAGRSQLEEMRAEWRPLLEGDRCPLVRNGDALTIHTFAGGRINATLAAILEQSGAARVAGFGDFGVDVTSPNEAALRASAVRDALRDVRDADVRLSAAEKAALVSDKARGKLAKFQPYLPPDLEGAYLAERLFDLVGAADVARSSEFPLV
jgi:ATP-dependent Lhr-like helicase